MISRTFSYSRILDYATCPQRYKKKNVLKILPRRKAKALAFGSCMSESLRVWRKSNNLDVAKEAFVNIWDQEGQILSKSFNPKTPEDYRTIERGFKILKAYTEEYPDEPKQIIQSEVKFDNVYLGNVEDTEIFLRGRIDSIFKIGNDISIDEDKTTSTLGPKFFNPLRDSMQVGLYLWVADQLGLFNIGGKSTTPRCILNAILVHPKKFLFNRDITIKSRGKLNEIAKNALNWVTQILVAESLDLFPKNDVDNSICTKYGGCDYLPLRYAQGSIEDRLLKTEYITRKKED